MGREFLDVFNNKNVFRLLGDTCHVLSKFILLYTIHRYRSAEGISFLTQLLYLNVFLFRYLDLFWTFKWDWYNTTLKLLYIGTSIYTLWLMLRKYPRSREGEREWYVSAWIWILSAIFGVIGFLGFRYSNRLYELLWHISLPLEAFHLLPQLSLLSYVSTPTAITSYYLLALGSYRALYILNWVERKIQHDKLDPVPVVWGVVQTYVYLEFAWVYWRRQKIKLRTSGGVLDSEDWVNSGFLLRLIFGRSDSSKQATGGSWRDWARNRFGRGGGGGGVSVSADMEHGYNDRDDDDLERGGATRSGPTRDQGTAEEGRVLVGGDSDDEDETTAWQSGGADDDGIVLAGSDDEDDDEDDDDEGKMTANEIHDRRNA